MADSANSVIQVLESYRSAVLSKDLDAYVALYDENVLAFDMWEQWSHAGLDEWRKMAEEWFNSLGTERVVVDLEDVQATQTPKLGYATAIVKYTAVSAEGSALRWLQNRITVVVEPQGDRWKIVHQHTSGPVDSGTMKVLLKR